MSATLRKTVLLVVITIGIVAAIAYVWRRNEASAIPEGFVTGNGRIEATEINVATKLAGRVEEIFADEGDFVAMGKPLVQMQTDVLEAQRAEAVATLHEAKQAAATAKAQLAMRHSDLAAAQALIAQRQQELNNAQRNNARIEQMGKTNAASTQEVDDARTRWLVAQAMLTSSQAQATAAEAAIDAARTQTEGAAASVAAREATIRRIEADIKDCVLTSPCDGRVQYRIAQPAEVLAAGGRALNVIDLSDVYMTFFLPETAAGKVALGTEVRLALDAFPQYVVPASVSFVASSAQFTPKTVETAEERQKLMFRVRAKISPALLKEHLEQVKTGLPGVAWVRLDPAAEWPTSLAVKIPESAAKARPPVAATLPLPTTVSAIGHPAGGSP